MPNTNYVAVLVLKLSLEAADAFAANATLDRGIALLAAELRRHGCSLDDRDIIVARAVD